MKSIQNQIDQVGNVYADFINDNDTTLELEYLSYRSDKNNPYLPYSLFCYLIFSQSIDKIYEQQSIGVN
jgi:hypothetical protein